MLNNRNIDHQNLIEFIRDIYETKEAIPLHAPYFDGNEKKYVEDTIDSTFVSSVGMYVDKFENNIAGFVKSKYAIATSNGTSALHICLLLNGCTNETEVITQSLSFVATSNAINYCGASPIFIDVDVDTLGMSPESLNFFLEKNCEVRNDGKCWNNKTNKIISACLPMHTYGFLSRIKEIKKICNVYKIALIEDSAESLGSIYEKKHSGTFGSMSAISFNGNKIITTGGGGIILTNSKLLAQKAKHLTTTAKKNHRWNFIHDHVGYNYRMPNINAALGLAQLEMLPKFIKQKRKIAYLYEEFAKENNYKMIAGLSNTTPNNWLNIFLSDNLKDRNLILKKSHKNKVFIRPAWQPLHLLKMYKDCQKERLSNTIWLFERIICLPSSVKFF